MDNKGRQPERLPQRDDPVGTTYRSLACEVGKRSSDIPSCNTGLLGRARFVLRELLDIWHHARFKDEAR